MSATGIVCTRCGRHYPLTQLYLCPACGGILKVEYDLTAVDKTRFLAASKAGVWTFADLLPVAASESVSLGEGGTPLLPAQHLADWCGLKSLYLKNEAINPTGSFKDRPISVGISRAKSDGAENVVIASSGNAAAAVSAYAARAGIRAIVCVPSGTPPAKVIQSLAYGALVVQVEGTYSTCYQVVRVAAEKCGWVNLTTTFINPFTVEGNKTIAYEIVSELGRVPDWLVVPLGDGPLLVGLWYGFTELLGLGLIDRLPRLAGIQAKNCAPVARAFVQGKSTVTCWTGSRKTIAGGIADQLVGYEQDGTHSLACVRASEGTIVTLTEEEILDAAALLARLEGVWAEPTGAVAAGAVKQLVSAGTIRAADKVVALVTGHGLKTAEMEGPGRMVATVKRSEELKEMVEERSNCGLL